MQNKHANTAGVMVDIAKGWKPNVYLSNVAIAAFQDPSVYVAKSIMPICPVSLSSGNYYVFSKEELAKDQVARKPAFGSVNPAIFSHTEADYSCKVDQVIIGIDQISALNYQRTGAPASIDPRRAKARLCAEQMNLHLDHVFAEKFFKDTAWANVKEGASNASTSGQFELFSNADADIIGIFDDYKRDILLAGLRMPNKLTLGYDAFVAMKNHPQFLERVTGSGSTPNPAKVNEKVIAEILGIEEVKVMYAVENKAGLGQSADMGFVCDSKSALLTYTSSAPSIEEPSAGYTFAWDMLGDGNWMAVSEFEGPGGTHSQFIEGLMALDMKKTCDDLAIFLKGCVE